MISLPALYWVHRLLCTYSEEFQPNNMISVSNLIHRMKKNARLGLATSCHPTMVLVTISAATNIYVGSENGQEKSWHLILCQGKKSGPQINQKFDEFASEHHLEIKNRDPAYYANFGSNHKKARALRSLSS